MSQQETTIQPVVTIPRQRVQVMVPDKDSASGERLVWMEIGGDQPRPHGCVCPPGAEATCQGWSCPRRAPMGLAPFTVRSDAG